MKDNFSTQSSLYAKYRPLYPRELFDTILSVVPRRGSMWDCGTGNGQAAHALAASFRTVCATDISSQQLQHAARRDNVFYVLSRAEESPFHDRIFDLITVGQAVHWFGFQQFYNEVARTLTRGGMVALFGYSRCSVDRGIDSVIDRLYGEILGRYWDAERHFVEERYQTIPFPFHSVADRSFETAYNWRLEEFTGYLRTWSAVQHYVRINGTDPIDFVAEELRDVWGDNVQRTVRFPQFLRIGSPRT